MPQGQKTNPKTRSNSVTNSIKILQMEKTNKQTLKKEKSTERLELVLSLATSPGESEVMHEITVEEGCCCSVVSDSDPMDHSTPGFPVLHDLLEFAQTHVH